MTSSEDSQGNHVPNTHPSGCDNHLVEVFATTSSLRKTTGAMAALPYRSKGPGEWLDDAVRRHSRLSRELAGCDTSSLAR